MRDREAKAAILAVLGPKRNRAEIEALLWPLRSTTPEQLRRLLRWLDQSGLALYFLASVQKQGGTEVLAPGFRAALESRMASNESRSADMFGEFQKVVDAFKREKVRFCAMKGFSLIPDFYPSVALRHQTDFDFLVAPESIENASRALVSIGYISNGVDEAGDSTFATPLQHVPSATDNIYAIQRQREIDLATSVRMAIHGVTVDLPLDFLERVECRDVAGFRFPALSTGDTFFRSRVACLSSPARIVDSSVVAAGNRIFPRATFHQRRTMGRNRASRGQQLQDAKRLRPRLVAR